jgi:hypothetical protein
VRGTSSDASLFIYQENGKMKNLIKNHWRKSSTDRICKYIGYGALLILLMLFVSFIYCSAKRNEQKHIANVMRIQTEVADINCYEQLHDATHLYFSIFLSRSGTKINVGDDTKGACRTLDARRRQSQTR